MDLKELFLKRRLQEDSEEPKKPDKTAWVILLLTGLLILIIAIPTNSTKKNETKETAVDSAVVETAAKAAADTRESQLEAVLSEMEGVGKVKVMITYQDNGTQVVEKDRTTNKESTTEADSSGGTRQSDDYQNGESTVYDGQNGEGSPFISRELTPEIEGVLVVAQGGDKISVRQNISNAVLALFPVEAHKIVVVKMNE